MLHDTSMLYEQFRGSDLGTMLGNDRPIRQAVDHRTYLPLQAWSPTE